MKRVFGIIAGILLGLVFSIPYFLLVFTIERAFFFLGFLIGIGVVIGYKKFVTNPDSTDTIIVVLTSLVTVFGCVILAYAAFLSKEFGASIWDSIDAMITIVKGDPMFVIKEEWLTIGLAVFGAFATIGSQE